MVVPVTGTKVVTVDEATFVVKTVKVTGMMAVVTAVFRTVEEVTTVDVTGKIVVAVAVDETTLVEVTSI